MAGKLKNSKRLKVSVKRAERGRTGTIFISTIIRKDGKDVLEQFRFPERKVVSLPTEVIAALRSRQVSVNVKAFDEEAVAEFQILPMYTITESKEQVEAEVE